MTGFCPDCGNTFCICPVGEPLDVAALQARIDALTAAADALAAAAQAFEQLRTETIEHGVSSDYSERYERLVEQRQAALAAYRAVRGGEG